MKRELDSNQSKKLKIEQDENGGAESANKHGQASFNSFSIALKEPMKRTKLTPEERTIGSADAISNSISNAKNIKSDKNWEPKSTRVEEEETAKSEEDAKVNWPIF